MGVVVKQEDRGKSIEGPTFFKGVSEIGPTTYEVGKEPHVDGVPVVELLNDMAEKAEQHDASEKSARAKAKAKASDKPEAKSVDAKADAK